MDIMDFLKQIGLNEKHFPHFREAFLMRPQWVRGQYVIIMISTAEILPHETYQDLKDCLKKMLECEVDLRISARRCESSITEIMNYLDSFSRETGEDVSGLIPEINGGDICLKTDDRRLALLRDYLSNRGFRQNITNIKNEPIVPVTEEKKPVRRPRRAEPVPTEEVSIDTEGFRRFPINRLVRGMDKVVFTGIVYSVEYRTFRNGNEMQKIMVSDYTDAICIKRIESDRKGITKEVMHAVKEKQVYDVYGNVKWDDYEKGVVVDVVTLKKLDYDPWERVDDWPGEKHIDLHVHTNRSEMDGICEAADLINKAYQFGQKAIAICDSGVVQAYPRMQGAHSQIRKQGGEDFKVIYGVEMKVVDEKLNIVTNPDDSLISKAEYMVYDLETTGLSTKYDHIIEFGGVIVRDNQIVEHFQTFIKPPVPLPPFIQQKTNITNAMLADAPTFEEAIGSILEFIGDRVMVAHNADFDFNFLNEKLQASGRKKLTNVCLDTLNLARQVLVNRKYFRLGLIAKNYGVSYDDEVAHRGDYDADVLAQILVKMLPSIEGYQTMTFRQLQENQRDDNFKKARPYSVTLLAKNMKGIKDIYTLVSLSHTKYLTYFAKDNAKKADSDIVAEPRITRSEIEKRRENILVGSSNLSSQLVEMAMNRSDEDLEKCMQFYDYVEIQPVSCYTPLMEEGSSVDLERIQTVIKNIIKIADKIGKPVVADNDVYYINPNQKIARDVYIMAKRIGGMRHPLYPLNRERRLKFKAPDQHLMTTGEMMEAFSFLGERAREFVIDNPKQIADSIEMIFPIPTKLAVPEIEGAEEKLTQIIYETAYEKYGNPLPEIVSKRIERELASVIASGNTVQYYIAHLLVAQSTRDGYVVGSRGSVGSSFIATMAKITEVNPLVPHYVCPKCKHSEFFTNNEYANGFDLPDKRCPVCGELMEHDGNNIPFETFLGFHGDKVPDIDLNFSADYQNRAMALIREIFGDSHTYRAGTIGTVAQKTAYGYIKGYCEEMELLDDAGKPLMSNAFMDFLSFMCMDVKRTTGQHPGGIVVIPKNKDVLDFTPIQYPANNPFAEWLTTHFAFADLHDNILKLDILGHVDPTVMRLLPLFTKVDIHTIPLNDPKAISLFNSTEALNLNDPQGRWTDKTGAAGLPEFGTKNNRGILEKTRPTTFAELVALSGLTHGTDVWRGNAESLIDDGICTLSEVIACRDDIMGYLIAKGMDPKESFDIMEKVRKGKGLTPEWISDMTANNVPGWYIESCNKIKYMFPKAHAVAYVMMAVRIAWYKVNYPAQHYAVYFTCRCDAYDIETMMKGEDAIYYRLKEVREKIAKKTATQKEKDLENTLEIALEMHLRGYHFNNISLTKSDAVYFTVDPDDDHGLIPSFVSIDGLGENVARSIVKAREEQFFTSRQDLQKRTQVNNTQLAFMERIGVLDVLSEEDQLTLFSF
ncbi:MAG: PolC-type DNA polymerase III [Erysipelotrichaceae bacterium]|nr:PolC-type DNA polymerase III [Erysipelotrichaceae bacterium]